MASGGGTGTAQVLADGRVTIPAPIRRQLGLERGDFVQIDIRPIEPVTEGDNE